MEADDVAGQGLLNFEFHTDYNMISYISYTYTCNC
jgi:hypothetical protein